MIHLISSTFTHAIHTHSVNRKTDRHILNIFKLIHRESSIYDRLNTLILILLTSILVAVHGLAEYEHSDTNGQPIDRPRTSVPFELHTGSDAHSPTTPRQWHTMSKDDTQPPAAGAAATADLADNAAVNAKYADLDTKRESSWPCVLFFIHLNILGAYGIAVLLSYTYFTTFLFTVVLTAIGIVGQTCGAHRLWAHRSYQANPFLRAILMLSQTMAGQVSGRSNVERSHDVVAVTLTFWG